MKVLFNKIMAAAGILWACVSLSMAQPCTGISISDADVCPLRIARVFYDNDAFNGTNQYYTQGIRAELIHPRFMDLYLAKRFLFRIGHRSDTYYGLSFTQKTFTPANLDTLDLQNDRPFASHLSIGHFLISNDRDINMRLTTELKIGLLGPASMGRLLTSGDSQWDNQIRTDVLLSYMALLEKGLYEARAADFTVFGRANLSTITPGIGGGALLRVGLLNPYFYALHFAPRSMLGGRDILKLQVYGYARAEATYRVYDATLQGGLLNNSSPYTLTSADINHFLTKVEVGVDFIYKKVGIGYQHVFQSKTFIAGKSHVWGQVKLIAAF